MTNLKEVNNQQLLNELEQRVINHKITEKQIEETFSKIQKIAKEKELEKAYWEWANDHNEQTDIKAKY